MSVATFGTGPPGKSPQGVHEPVETYQLGGTFIVCSCGWHTPRCVNERGAMTSWRGHRRREAKKVAAL